MTDRFSAGDSVRVSLDDPAGHTRAPRYLRGRTGTVVTADGVHPLPDDVVAGVDPPRLQTVYAVRFTAGELFGAGRHSVTVDLWEQYLDPRTREQS